MVERVSSQILPDLLMLFVFPINLDFLFIYMPDLLMLFVFPIYLDFLFIYVRARACTRVRIYEARTLQISRRIHVGRQHSLDTCQTCHLACSFFIIFCIIRHIGDISRTHMSFVWTCVSMAMSMSVCDSKIKNQRSITSHERLTTRT